MRKQTNNNYSELCALVNKPSGASAGASDLKYYRSYGERSGPQKKKNSGATAGTIYALILSQYLFL